MACMHLSMGVGFGPCPVLGYGSAVRETNLRFRGTAVSSIDLTAIKPGDQIDCVLALTALQQKKTKRGDPYLRITLANETGAVEVNIWSNQMSIMDGITPIRAVHVAGQIGEYEGSPEVKLYAVSLAEEDHPVLMNLNGVCPIPFDDLMVRLDALRDRITKPGYRLFLDRFFEVGCPWESYSTAPAAMGNHHNYIHGLLEHSIEMTETAVAMSESPRFRDRIDFDLLITSGLVHDSGKTVEYAWKGGPIRMSEAGLLGNHMVYGPEQARRAFESYRDELEAAGFTERDLLLIQHIQMSHHGRKEWGAVTEPKFAEALMIHNADMVSAHTHKMLNAIDGGTNGAIEGWASVGYPYHELLDTSPKTEGEDQDPALEPALGLDGYGAQASLL